MLLHQLPTKNYVIIALILKDSPGARLYFTFKELFKTLENIGFTQMSNGQWSYKGKVLIVSKHGEKSRDTVLYARQNQLKSQMLLLFRWDKGTFVERIEL